MPRERVPENFRNHRHGELDGSKQFVLPSHVPSNSAGDCNGSGSLPPFHHTMEASEASNSPPTQCAVPSAKNAPIISAS